MTGSKADRQSCASLAIRDGAAGPDLSRGD